jgi:hypothetical protein
MKVHPAMCMKTMGSDNMPSWREANAQRDVKNEGCSGDVYENKGRVTKCTPQKQVFYPEI